MRPAAAGERLVLMERIRQYFEQHPGAVNALIYCYIVFAGCVVFPLGNSRNSPDLMKAYLVLASYGTIGATLAIRYGPGRGKRVWGITLVLTMAGLICRYLLEYGEVSNTLNFTVPGVLSYLLLIPVLTLSVYHLTVRHLLRKP